MISAPLTKIKIVHDLDDLPPEGLAAVAEFVEFLRTKAASPRAPQQTVKLEGLWQGYTFSEEDIRAARREAWASLGQSWDA